jgi:hypothetical protein
MMRELGYLGYLPRSGIISTTCYIGPLARSCDLVKGVT